MKKRVIILVSGIVQGVFFRAETVKKAKELNLTGWVRNESDGSVKIATEGEKENLEKLIEWVKKGPRLAQVDGIEVKWDKARGESDNFEIRY